MFCVTKSSDGTSVPRFVAAKVVIQTTPPFLDSGSRQLSPAWPE
jgi:hypothetical protein